MVFKNDAEALAAVKSSPDMMLKTNLFLEFVDALIPEFSTEDKAKVCELVATLLATLPEVAAENTMLGAMGLIETKSILNMAAACMSATLLLEEKANLEKETSSYSMDDDEDSFDN